jgi:hypothetical protein
MNLAPLRHQRRGGFSLSGETIFAALDGLGISREADLTTSIEVRRTGSFAAASA